MLKVFLVGLALGFYAAATPGPINLEVIRRSIARGSRIGLPFGLGACLADVLFVLLSSLGALAIINSLPLWGRAVMWLVGSMILFWLGVKGLMVKLPPSNNNTPGKNASVDFWEDQPKVTIGDMVSSFLFGLALTLTSPPTILFWVFTSLSIASTNLNRLPHENVHVPYLLAAGVGVACTIWVTGAAFVSGKFHRNLRPRTYLWVERIAGIAFCGFAVFALIKAIITLIKI